MNNFKYVGLAIAIVGLLAIPQIQYLKDKKGYFKIVEDYDGYLGDKQAELGNVVEAFDN